MTELKTDAHLLENAVMCRAVDNLELLLSQPDESVDLIYCDILYGTGRNFGDYQDFVGCSNLAECVCPLLPNPCYK